MRTIQPTKKPKRSTKKPRYNEDTAYEQQQPTATYNATKPEPIDYGLVITKVEPRDHYTCIETPIAELPTTLEDLHDDEHDGGYCSASSDYSGDSSTCSSCK